MPAPDVVASVKELREELKSIVTALGGLSTISNPQGGRALSGKNMNEIMMENNKQLEEVSKNLIRTRDTQEKSIKEMQMVAAGLAIVGPALGQYAKYGIALPFQMLSGISSQIGQGMLQRERDMAQTITSTVGGLVGLINPAAGAAIVGLGAVAAPVLGQVFRQDTIKASTRKEFVEYMASGRLGIEESFLYNYHLARGNAAAKSMRAGPGGTAKAISDTLTQMGIGPEESAQAAMAIMSQGARGYSKFSMHRAKVLTDIGGYGFDPVQMAIALQTGNRTGFSEEELKAASKRTGFLVPQMAQAAQMVRGQTFFMGMDAGNQFFKSATNTTMSQIMGAPASAQALMQTGQATAQSAMGNEAAEMILFQQFQAANPGTSYLDFLEARTMGSSSDKWKNMMAHAAKSFSSMGQMGGVLGVGLGLFKGASKEAMGASTKYLRQAAGEIGVEPLTKEEKNLAAALDVNAINRQTGIRADAEGISRRISAEPSLQESMTNTHIGLLKNSQKLQGLSDATAGAAEVTKKELIPQMQALEHALYRAGEWLTGGIRTDWDKKREAETQPKK